MSVASINGQSIYYEDTGRTAAAVLAFSHGILMDREMFAPQVEAFRSRYRCVAWDERGHGRTAGERLEPFSYYDSADDLAALLRHLAIDKAVLVGMSQGGFLSLRCALTHPDLVRALVLIDTQAGTDTPEANKAILEKVCRWQNGGLSPDIADETERLVLGVGWPGAASWRSKWAGMSSTNLAQCFQTLVNRDDILDRMSTITVPALVIHGSADQAITLDKAELLASEMPNAKLVVIEDAAHAPNLTHANAVNAAIRTFLDGIPS